MSDFFIQIEKLLSALGDAEYRYLLLEPLIFYGILVGVVMLVTGLCTKAPKLQTAALVTIGVSALAHVPYKEARLASQPRMEQVYEISAPARVKGFNENTEAWLASSWQFRLLVLAAGAGVLVGVSRNRLGFAIGIATALLGLVAAKNAMWLHYQDAIAYHPNLKRHEAPIDRRESADLERTRQRAPDPATAETAAPASSSAPSDSAASPGSPPPARPLSSPSHRNEAPSGRIPPPEAPAPPRARPVVPLGR